MAYKFPRAFRHRFCNGVEDLTVQTSGHDDSEGSVWSPQTGSGDVLSEVSGQAAQRLGLRIPLPQSFLRTHEICRDDIERISYGCYLARSRCAQQALQHDWKNVGVLMRIEVR